MYKCIYAFVYVSISIFICTYMLYTFFSFFLEEMKCDSCPALKLLKFLKISTLNKVT